MYHYPTLLLFFVCLFKMRVLCSPPYSTDHLDTRAADWLCSSQSHRRAPLSQFSFFPASVIQFKLRILLTPDKYSSTEVYPSSKQNLLWDTGWSRKKTKKSKNIYPQQGLQIQDIKQVVECFLASSKPRQQAFIILTYLMMNCSHSTSMTRGFVLFHTGYHQYVQSRHHRGSYHQIPQDKHLQVSFGCLVRVPG